MENWLISGNEKYRFQMLNRRGKISLSVAVKNRGCKSFQAFEKLSCESCYLNCSIYASRPFIRGRNQEEISWGCCQGNALVDDCGSCMQEVAAFVAQEVVRVCDIRLGT